MLRIETLQSKEKAAPETSGGGGWGLFGGSQAVTQELEKVKQDLEVAQEELEAIERAKQDKKAKWNMWVIQTKKTHQKILSMSSKVF